MEPYVSFAMDKTVELLAIDSPTGYTREAERFVSEQFAALGFPVTRTVKGGVLVDLGGEDAENALLLEAHADTLGGMVAEIKGDGRLRIVNVGGMNANNAEAENCRVVTKFSGSYEGTLQLINASVHVNGDYASTKRSWDTVEVVLDEAVESADDVKALGISVGDFVCFEPRTRVTKSGYIKSRFLDDKLSVGILLGFAKYLHDSLPNATYVGFTGTPIDATIDVFGEVVDAYTMTESVTDEITRRIVYEGRAAKVLLDNKKLQEIEQYYKQCTEEGANEYQIEESKKAVTKMERILGDSDRLQAVAEDFIVHYEKRIEEGSTVEGKAMFVCSNRTIAFNLYKKIIALRPEWAKIPGEETRENHYVMAAEPRIPYGNQELPIEKIKLIMTRSKDDEPELYNLLGTDEDRRAFTEEFKKTKSNFKIAIVVDMWTTGFDVDCLDTMYIDKPLQQHTLVQTISRVNRVYPGKEKGLVVDYIGIKSNMNVALKRYAQGDANLDSVENVEQSVTMVKDELDIIRRMFGGFDYSAFTTGTPLEQLDCLNKGAEFVQRTKEQENLFMGHAKKLKSAFNLCSNHEEISDAEREEIHYFTGIRSIIYKLTIGDTPDASQMNRRVSEMIEEAIQSEGVEEIIQIGNDKENLDVLSEEYMERLGKLKLPNTKVKLMERLLKTVITEFKKVNKAKGVDFSKRLNALVDKYNDRRDNAIFADEVLTEVANQMADLLKELNKEKKSFLDLGISYEEKAFYDILKAIAKQFGFEYPEEKLLKLAAKIKKIVADKSKYTDWSTRDDIKAELKMDLILVLAEYGYPPVTNDEVFKEILEQAENFKKYNG